MVTFSAESYVPDARLNVGLETSGVDAGVSLMFLPPLPPHAERPHANAPKTIIHCAVITSPTGHQSCSMLKTSERRGAGITQSQGETDSSLVEQGYHIVRSPVNHDK